MLERERAVDMRLRGRQNQHRHAIQMTLAADVFQYLDAVDFGQIQIDDYDIGQPRRIHLPQSPDGLLAVVGALEISLNPMRTQGFFDQKDIGVVIFHDEDLCGVLCHRTRFGPGRAAGIATNRS